MYRGLWDRCHLGPDTSNSIHIYMYIYIYIDVHSTSIFLLCPTEGRRDRGKTPGRVVANGGAVGALEGRYKGVERTPSHLRRASWGATPPSIGPTFQYTRDAVGGKHHKLSEGIILAGVDRIRDLDYQKYFRGREQLSVLKEKGVASVAETFPDGGFSRAALSAASRSMCPAGVCQDVPGCLGTCEVPIVSPPRISGTLFCGVRKMVSVLKEKGLAPVAQALRDGGFLKADSQPLPRELVSEMCISPF